MTHVHLGRANEGFWALRHQLRNEPADSALFLRWQMGFEDDYNPSGTITKVTRNVLGARGIDRISITENSATTHGYSL